MLCIFIALKENDNIEPLILWTPDASMGEEGPPIKVDSRLTLYLRPHQREGVKFMFDCVSGIKDFDGQGRPKD